MAVVASANARILKELGARAVSTVLHSPCVARVSHVFPLEQSLAGTYVSRSRRGVWRMGGPEPAIVPATPARAVRGRADELDVDYIVLLHNYSTKHSKPTEILRFPQPAESA